MPSKKCIRCHARFASASGYCAPCRELVDEQNKRSKLGAQVGALESKITNLQAEVAAQRRYTVVTDTVWKDLTWNEAVAKADSLFQKGIYFLYIKNERGERVRTWAADKGIKVTA